LVLAGLVAKGDTTVDRIYHIDRGMSASRKSSPHSARQFAGGRPERCGMLPRPQYFLERQTLAKGRKRQPNVSKCFRRL